jgi:hypothetical protein
MLHKVQVINTSQNQLFRGDCVNQAFMVELLQRNHYLRTPIKRRNLLGPKKDKQKTLDQWKSKFEIFGSNRHVFVRRGVGERMISACVIPNVKHGGGGVMVWWCFASDTVSDLFRIQGTLNQHGYHSTLQ